MNEMVTDKLTNGYGQTNIEISFVTRKGSANKRAAEYQNETVWLLGSAAFPMTQSTLM